MKNKSSHLFWGFLFLTIGLLYFLEKLDMNFLYFDLSWDLWPVILILIGIGIITTGSVIKPIISSLMGIIIGLFLFGSFNGLFNDDDSNWHNDVRYKNIEINYTPDIKYANCTINGGAGTIRIDDTDEALVEGNIQGILSGYSISSHTNDSTAWIDIETGPHKFKLFRKGRKNKLKLHLNRNPIWNFEFNVGAVKSDFDFSNLKVKTLVLKSGAAKIDIKLGNKVDNCYLNVEMGAAKLSLFIPKDTGCKVISNTFIVDKKLPGFTEMDDNVYTTENYKLASKKIIVDISAGVSQIKVKRY